MKIYENEILLPYLMNSVVSAGKYMPPVLLHSGGAR